MLFLLLTLNIFYSFFSVSIAGFEQVNNAYGKELFSLCFNDNFDVISCLVIYCQIKLI